jgi:hypothetical protein
MTERFTLLSELGRGGMGVVWKARNEETGQIVALKLLRETYAEDSDYVSRFERELELAKRIHSRNVIQVLGYGVRDKTPYLALEFVDGPSLRERLASHGAYSWAEARPLLAQIAQGLADAHAAGVVHRDLKPSNVLIGSDGVAKLADFGIAKGLDLTRMTGTSTLLGTPAYLPPEGPADERSDLYSFGVIAYEILTGVVPFEGRTYQEVILRHVREAPDLEKLPVEARPVVGWLLAKDAADRPQRTAELLSVLWGGAQVPVPATSQSSRLPGTPPKAAQTQPSGTIEGQIQLGQPAAPGLANPPQTVRRSSITLVTGLAAVALVACIAAVTLAGGFLKGAAGASPSVPVVIGETSAEPTGTPAPTPPPGPIPPPTPTPGFSSTGSMATSRAYHTATLLADGRILIVGGVNGTEYLTSAEIYDPKTGIFSVTGSMSTGRAYHAATLLSDGRVLVAGGSWDRRGSAETYDPKTGLFSPTGLMIAARMNATATLLSDGRVLIAGGDIPPDGRSGSGNPLASAEMYNPKTGTFSSTGSMRAARSYHTATLFSDGRVLVAGGVGSGSQLASAEIYNPKTGTFSSTGSMVAARNYHAATLLSDSRVLVAGGLSSGRSLASAEIYDPMTGTFSSTGSMIAAHMDATATTLSDGRALLAGGEVSFGTALASAEIYDPKTGAFSPAGSMTTARGYHTATLLTDGRVLVAGGANGTEYFASAEIYTP